MFGKYKLNFLKLNKTILCLSVFTICYTSSSCQYLYEQSLKEKKREELINTKIAIITNYLNQLKPHKAITQVRNLQKEYPHHVKVLNISGLTHLALKNPIYAEKVLSKAYKESPLTYLGLNLSSALLELNKTNQAIKILKSLIKDKEYERKERIYHNLGLAYMKKNKHSQAQKYFEKALTENPVFYLSSFHLANCYQRRGMTDLAEKEYSRASKFCPTCYEPIKKLYDLLKKRKKFRDADQLIRKYVNQKEIQLNDKEQAISLLNKKERADKKNFL